MENIFIYFVNKGWGEIPLFDAKWGGSEPPPPLAETLEGDRIYPPLPYGIGLGDILTQQRAALTL